MACSWCKFSWNVMPRPRENLWDKDHFPFFHMWTIHQMHLCKDLKSALSHDCACNDIIVLSKITVSHYHFIYKIYQIIILFKIIFQIHCFRYMIQNNKNLNKCLLEHFGSLKTVEENGYSFLDNLFQYMMHKSLEENLWIIQD